MGSLSVMHWVIVLLIVVMVFGTKKLKNMGHDLGGAIQGFKAGMNEGGGAASSEAQALQGQLEQGAQARSVADEQAVRKS